MRIAYSVLRIAYCVLRPERISKRPERVFFWFWWFLWGPRFLSFLHPSKIDARISRNHENWCPEAPKMHLKVIKTKFGALWAVFRKRVGSVSAKDCDLIVILRLFCGKYTLRETFSRFCGFGRDPKSGFWPSCLTKNEKKDVQEWFWKKHWILIDIWSQNERPGEF